MLQTMKIYEKIYNTSCSEVSQLVILSWHITFPITWYTVITDFNYKLGEITPVQF